MKWGIIDNYQQPKRSYNYVKKAYQPLLVNLHFKKRRWSNSEAFAGEVWVVNDLYKAYTSCEIKLEIKDHNGKVINSKRYAVETIEENSAKKFFDIEANVLKKVEKQFFVTLQLLDSKGQALSSNDYLFLIGDQEKATAQFNQMRDAMKKKNSKYTYGNYFRFYDKMARENGKDYESEVVHPKAEGY
ncbi:hypothetical protein [Fulvivirga sp. M361]|uniref:hypothetical protein n=1 Tax=Fulvivirga sp. M361 TaxID=2594266 RepID=UPI001C889F53|nr:hypothetical protein [Fulvivirga sp. M361]